MGLFFNLDFKYMLLLVYSSPSILGTLCILWKYFFISYQFTFITLVLLSSFCCSLFPVFTFPLRVFALFHLLAIHSARQDFCGFLDSEWVFFTLDPPNTKTEPPYCESLESLIWFWLMQNLSSCGLMVRVSCGLLLSFHLLFMLTCLRCAGGVQWLAKYSLTHGVQYHALSTISISDLSLIWWSAINCNWLVVTSISQANSDSNNLNGSCFFFICTLFGTISFF